jgi:hypothetical protein
MRTNSSGPSNLHSRACALGPGRLSTPGSSSPERSLPLAPKTRSLGTNGMTTFGVARLTSCAYTSHMPDRRFAPLNERFLIHQQITQVVGVLFLLEPKFVNGKSDQMRGRSAIVRWYWSMLWLHRCRTDHKQRFATMIPAACPDALRCGALGHVSQPSPFTPSVMPPPNIEMPMVVLPRTGSNELEGPHLSDDGAVGTCVFALSPTMWSATPRLGPRVSDRYQSIDHAIVQ